MSMTIDTLKKLADGEELRYFIDPKRDSLLLNFSGMSGGHQFVIVLSEGGKFLQFRTINYLHCAANHPHVDQVLRVLGAINFRMRLVKFGWDQNDGEIVGYLDTWIEDTQPSQQQFKHMVRLYMGVVDVGFVRIKKTMESGKDPGDMDPAEMLSQLLGSGKDTPPKVKKLLEQIQAKLKGRRGEKDVPEVI